jgi:hypothetical protein
MRRLLRRCRGTLRRLAPRRRLFAIRAAMTARVVCRRMHELLVDVQLIRGRKWHLIERE